MPAVSVIIPIYKVERYLERCFESLLAQGFADWEAICVDDGSPDGCPAMVDAMAAKDSRFVAVHKANGGLSDARNAGMAVAQGKYILYLDADDFLHPQALELCVLLAERDGSDLVAFTYDRAYRTALSLRHILHLPERKARFKKYSLDNVESLKTNELLSYATEYSKPADIDRRWAVKHCQVWRCLYRKSLIENIPFIKGINYEDFPWWSEVLLKAESATILNLPLYMYYPNFQSYIFSANQEHRVESLRVGLAAARELYKTAPERKAELWRKHFLVPFEQKLCKKEEKLKRR